MTDHYDDAQEYLTRAMHHTMSALETIASAIRELAKAQPPLERSRPQPYPSVMGRHGLTGETETSDTPDPRRPPWVPGI